MAQYTHPLYDEKIEDWKLLRDSADGERSVKDAGAEYLPPTPGHVEDGYFELSKVGIAAYNAYKQRAVYPDFFEEGIKTLIGILNAKEAQIDLPPNLEYLRDKSTSNGETLGAVLRKVHQEQLITGRVGLLADLPKNPDQTNPQQYIAIYAAEKILNWDTGGFNAGLDTLNMVVLDESGYERSENYQWKKKDKFRILTLGGIGESTALGDYRAAVVENLSDEVEGTELVTPTLLGATLNRIPFVFVSAKDLSPDPDRPPLLGLARLCMTIYRGEADYRQTLFMQGQDTFVVIGGVRTSSGDPSETLRVGAGARVDIEMGGDAKYVGIGATGLPEQRMALETDRMLAAVRTGQLLAPGKMSMESGEALKTRVAAQTATLTSVAISSAAALEQLLKIMAKWQGGGEDQVKVTPNLDFTNVAIQGQDLVQLVTAKNLGYPLSHETLFEVAKERGLTRNTFEVEMERLLNDPPELIKRAAELAAPASGNNPTQQAGGPKKSTAGVGAKTNKPKK